MIFYHKFCMVLTESTKHTCMVLTGTVIHDCADETLADDKDRLLGFILEADQENTSLAFVYTDPNNTNVNIYRIQSTTPHIPVSKVTIISKNFYDGGIFVTLCEVEMFGDAVCPALTYGRECEKTCNCVKEGENCFVSTGGCPSGCPAGYQGEGCLSPCSKTYFGLDCSQTCSTNCKDQDCQPTNGTCLSCIPGKRGSLCDKDCNPKFWGDSCSKPCSSNCKDELCNAINGTCFSCAAGKYWENCSKDCNQTFYGENCVMSCSSNCADQLCNGTNGNCQSCVTGESGLFCDKACPLTTFGKDCNETCSTNCTNQLCDSVNGKCDSCAQGSAGVYCDNTLTEGESIEPSPPVAAIVVPVVAFVVLVTLIVIGVLIWRRRRQKMRTVKSNAVTTNPDKTVSGQSMASVMKKANDNQDNPDFHQHVDASYYNFVPRLSEIPTNFSDQDLPLAQHTQTCNNQVNSVQTSSRAAIAAAPSSEKQNTDRLTYTSDFVGYEIPMKSPALTQKSEGLQSEDQVTYADDTMANPYESVDDIVPNPYEEIHDI